MNSVLPYHTSMVWNVWDELNYIIFEGDRLIISGGALERIGD